MTIRGLPSPDFDPARLFSDEEDIHKVCELLGFMGISSLRIDFRGDTFIARKDKDEPG